MAMNHGTHFWTYTASGHPYRRKPIVIMAGQGHRRGQRGQRDLLPPRRAGGLRPVGRRGERRVVVRQAAPVFQEARNGPRLRRPLPRAGRSDPGAARQAGVLGPHRGRLLRGMQQSRLPRRPRHEPPRHLGRRPQAGQLLRRPSHQHGRRLPEPQPRTRQPDDPGERPGLPDCLRRTAGRRRRGRSRRRAPHRPRRRGHRLRGRDRVAVPPRTVGHRTGRAGARHRRARRAGPARSRSQPEKPSRGGAPVPHQGESTGARPGGATGPPLHAPWIERPQRHHHRAPGRGGRGRHALHALLRRALEGAVGGDAHGDLARTGRAAGPALQLPDGPGRLRAGAGRRPPRRAAGRGPRVPGPLRRPRRAKRRRARLRRRARPLDPRQPLHGVPLQRHLQDGAAERPYRGGRPAVPATRRGRPPRRGRLDHARRPPRRPHLQRDHDRRARGGHDGWGRY